MKRYIDEEGLRRVLRSAVPEGTARTAAITGVDRWLVSQPVYPRLVGTTAAAKILGIKPPHVTRLREQGRMPDPIEVEGSVDVYVREDVEALGVELRRERRARAQRRTEREEAGAA